MLIDKGWNAQTTFYRQDFFVVMGDGYHVLEISWTPNEAGNCREVIMMKYDLGFRVHAVIVGYAEEHKKKVRKFF